MNNCLAHIICLQETRRLSFNNSPSFTYYNQFRDQQMGGGLIIGVSNQFVSREKSQQFEALKQLGIEFQAVQVINQSVDALIFNIYIGNGVKFHTIKNSFTQIVQTHISLMSPSQQIIVCGDFNCQQVPLNSFSYFPPTGIKTFKRIQITKKNKQRILHSRTDHIMIFPPQTIKGYASESQNSDHMILVANISIIQKQQHFIKLFDKKKAYQLNLYAESRFNSFTPLCHYILNNIQTLEVIKNQRIKIKQRNKKNCSISEYLESIEKDYCNNESKQAFSKIKRFTILNPNKRDGSVFNAYFNEFGNIQFDSITENCVVKLSQLSGVLNKTYIKLPSLRQLKSYEVIEIQQRMSWNKASSFDCFSDKWLKQTKSWHLLCDLWQESTVLSNPKIFKCRLVPLNKVHPNIPNSQEFRPIVILSPLFKFMELRFINKLNAYTTHKMNKDQQGFVPGSGTNVCHAKLLKQLQQAWRSKIQLNCLFIDFKNAYNCVNRSLLYKIIEKKSILDKEEIEFLREFQNRLFFQLKDGSKIHLKNGVPQGSPLSPALFDIYMEQFVLNLRRSSQVNFMANIYADDLTLLFPAQQTENIILAIEEQSTRFNLTVNKQKSGIFQICQSDKESTRFIQGYPVVQEYKYLGVSIDSHGSILPQITNLKKSLIICQKLKWLTSPLSFRFKLILWKVYILPRFLYMLPSLMISGNQDDFNKVEIIWRKSQRDCLHLPKCCANEFLDLLVGPLKDWAFIVNQQMKIKIQQRVESTEEQDIIKEKLAASLSQKWGKNSSQEQLQKTGKQTFKNLPINLDQLFSKQMIICKYHKTHQTFKHLLQQHLKIGMKDFYNLIFNEKANPKARKKLEERIDQLMKTQDDDRQLNDLYICSP